MKALKLLAFVAGVLIALYGGYSMIFEAEKSAFIFIFGGIVITAIAAGLIGKAHKEGSENAGR